MCKLNYDLGETIRCTQWKKLCTLCWVNVFDHQEVDLALKSPNMIETDSLRALMSDKRCSKFVKKLSISSLFWLGEG